MSFEFNENDVDEAALEAHEYRIRRCRSCNAKIIWFRTAAGKNTPIDADTVEVGDARLDLSRHVSHFSTCPNANQHRRPR